MKSATGEKLNDVWNKIDSTSIPYLKDDFEKIAYPLIQFIVESYLDKDQFEIGTFEDGRQQGATLVCHDVLSQKTAEIRMRKNSSYELILSILDLEEEAHVFRYKLSNEDISIIPHGFRCLIEQVKIASRPITFHNCINE